VSAPSAVAARPGRGRWAESRDGAASALPRGRLEGGAVKLGGPKRARALSQCEWLVVQLSGVFGFRGQGQGWDPFFSPQTCSTATKQKDSDP